MKDGYKVIDMDTHVNPSIEVLEKYVDPPFRPRLVELHPYYSVRQRARPDGTIQTSKTITVAPIPYDRFPGEAPVRSTPAPYQAHARRWRGGSSPIIGGPSSRAPMRKTLRAAWPIWT